MIIYMPPEALGLEQDQRGIACFCCLSCHFPIMILSDQWALSLGQNRVVFVSHHVGDWQQLPCQVMTYVHMRESACFLKHVYISYRWYMSSRQHAYMYEL